MPLTDRFVKTVEGIPRRHFDGGGLYLQVLPTGVKSWRMKYRFGGREKLLSFGLYPEVSLKTARLKRDAARLQLSEGHDPGLKVREEKAERDGANQFESVAEEWIAGHELTKAASHTTRIRSLLKNDVYPYIGKTNIANITAPELLVVLRRVEKRVLERAHRARGVCGQVFRYAIATGKASRNPAEDLKGALPMFKGKHFAAPTDPKTLAPILRKLYSYQGTPTVCAALKLAPLVFVRPGELRKALWEDIDFEAAEWRYTSSKTKQAHIVPLAKQSIAILKSLVPLNDRSRYVFPSARSNDRPMSDNALLVAFRSMGITNEELTGHGLRATARTILDEVLHFRPDIIEHQLAHAVKDPNGRAYNRTAHLEARQAMMQRWADYIDELRSTEVIQFPKAG